MPSYRVYTLSKDERIHSPPRVIDCPDDEAAINEARRWLDGHALEVWDKKRRIGRLEPDEEGPP